MKLLSVITVLIVSLQAFAADITVGPNAPLSKALADINPSTISLRVNGTIEADSLMQLREALPHLTTLDLSATTIVPPTIPPYTFAATSIARFTAPASLQSIGEAAFAATPLEKFVATPSLETIGDHAFAHCLKLTSFECGDNLSAIGQHALSDCPLLTTFTSGPSLVTIGDHAMESSGINSLDLSRCTRLDYIGARAFAACGSLQQVMFPNHHFTIGDGALAFCRLLAAITGLQGLTTLPALFAADDSVLALDLWQAASLASIGDHALHGVISPTTISLPASLKCLDTHAMEGMTALTTIDASALTTVPALGNEVWHGLDPSKITLLVAEGMEADFLAADQWRDFTIKSPSSGIDEVTADSEAPTISISGTTITATAADGASVYLLAVYLVDGRTAAMLRGSSSSLSVNLDSLDGRPIIINAADSKGRRVSLSTIL